MAKPYRTEMASLADTLGWATVVDLSELEKALRTALLGPLIAVGSGGSLSAAHALAHFHQLISGHVSTVLTPLESVAVRQDSDTAIWLLSASGNNVDIVRAAKTLVVREPRQLAALIGRENSKVSQIAQSHPYMDALTYAPPTGKDGFLATNTLFGAVAVLARAYSAVAPASSPGDILGLGGITDAVDGTSSLVNRWQEISNPLWERDTTVVLHGASGKLGAIDLESKFTEAAIGHAQIADFRNFAHGRHHWLAKRGDGSGVIALIGDDDQDIAERTLALLPPQLPIARIAVGGPPMHASLMSLVAAFRLTDWAGQARGIDPGDPGVPDFGRRIYRLAPPRRPTSSLPLRITQRVEAAIQRKSGRTVTQLAKSSELTGWHESCRAFQRKLANTSLSGVVLDYDGTVVDTRYRFSPPNTDVVDEMIRLLNFGIPLGIATGRGRSVRQAFKETIPRELWSRIVVGYYNGAEVSTLDDDSVPQSEQSPVPELRDIADRLLSEPELVAQSRQEHRRNQLTITACGALREDRLWEIVQSIVRESATDLTVLRSSHSIDVLSSAASKLNVTRKLQAIAPTAALLAIGDRGRWPGNDHALLSTPLALSVDQCSPSRDTCWNLGAPGQRGPAITLEYLRALQPVEGGQARFDGAALR